MGLIEGRQLEESVLHDIRRMARFKARSKVRVAPKCAVRFFLLTLLPVMQECAILHSSPCTWLTNVSYNMSTSREKCNGAAIELTLSRK